MKVSEIINNGFFDCEEWQGYQGRDNLSTFSWENEFQKNQIFQRIKEELDSHKVYSINSDQEIEIKDKKTWKTVYKVNLNELEFELNNLPKFDIDNLKIDYTEESFPCEDLSKI